jgi:WD40 repeat protein
MGVVYKARQISLKRLVALKMILGGAHAEDQELIRFRREAEAVARLHHPNIVDIYEIGNYSGRPFFSFEFVEGGTLTHKLAGTPLPGRVAAELLETLARAMHAAHQQRVVHRDLKPANVLLTSDGVPKITDFGLAKRLGEDAGQTQSGMLVGTPSYMAPELASGRGHQVGATTDVYALGAILYETLTGRPPFRGATVMETLDQVRTQEAVAPSRLQPKTPRDLETICLKCLQKEPNKRYTSALDLAEDLRRFAKGEPIEARPIGLWERTVKWARRRPAWAALILVTFIASFGLAAGFAWYTLQLGRSLAETRVARGNAEESEHRARQFLYASDMNLAHQFWKNGEVKQVLSLLERHRSGTEDVRGFEWHYLDQLCHSSDALTLFDEEEETVWVAFSADGRSLATMGRTGTVKLWDAGTRRPRLTLRTQDQQAVKWFALSPDNKSVTTLTQEAMLRQWNVDTGKELAIRQLTKETIVRAAFSRHANLLATALRNRTIKVWDIHAGKELMSLRESRGNADHFSAIEALAFAPDGKTLGTVGNDRIIRFWSLSTGLETRPLWRDAKPTALAFSGDGRMLAIADVNGVISQNDIVSGTTVNHVRGHNNRVRSLAYSPDNKTLATGGDDSAVRLWDASGLTLRTTLKGHTEKIHCLSFAPDGQTLASAGDDGKVKLWDPLMTQERKSLVVSLWPNGAIAFSPDGKALAVGDRDLTAKIVTTATGQIDTILRGPRKEIKGLAYSPDGRSVAVADGEGKLRLFDANNGKARLDWIGHQGEALCVAFSPSGDLLASGGQDKLIKLWRMPEGRERTALTGHAGAVTCLAFAPDGKSLAAGDSEGSLKLWDCSAGKVASNLDRIAPVTSLAFSHNGRMLASAHGDGHLILWEAAVGRKLAELSGVRQAMRSVSFSPDDNILAAVGDLLYLWEVGSKHLRYRTRTRTGSSLTFSPKDNALALASDGHVELWSLAAWRVLQPLGQQPQSALHSVAFSSDSKSLITGGSDTVTQVTSFPFSGRSWNNWSQVRGSTDEAIRLWDVDSRQQKAVLPLSTPTEVRTIALAPDGRTVAAGIANGAIWLWDTQSQQRRSTLFVSTPAAQYWKLVDKMQALSLPVSPNYTDDVWALAYSPDSRTLASGSGQGMVQLWDLVTGREIVTLPEKHEEVAALAFSPDGATLAVNHLGQIKLWDLATMKLRQTLTGHKDSIRCLAFSPDCSVLVSGAKDWRIKLWDLVSGQERASLIGHLDTVAAVAFSPDGKTLASGSFDATVKLWHRATGQELATLEKHPGRVLSVAFSPDGKILVSGCETPTGGDAFFWHAPGYERAKTKLVSHSTKTDSFANINRWIYR